MDMPGSTHQGVLYQDAAQSLQSQQSYPSPSSSANAVNAQQQMTDWVGDGRYIQQPLRYPGDVQPVYDFREQLITPGNVAFHPGNINQLVQYAYSVPQQRHGQGPVAHFTPWQTIFTPGPALTWTQGAIQGSALEGQGNQILNRNLQQDTQPGIFIHNGQAQLQQLKQVDGQHVSMPTTAITNSFSSILPNTASTVNNVRTQQAQMHALQMMLQSQRADTKFSTKNTSRMMSAATLQKNNAKHDSTAICQPPHPPLANGAAPGQMTRSAPASGTPESKRMKQSQMPEESSRKEPPTLQLQQKRYQQMLGIPGLVPHMIGNGSPATPEGAMLAVRHVAPSMTNMVADSGTGVNAAIQNFPGMPTAQGVRAALPAQSQSVAMEQGYMECKKKIQLFRGSAAGHDQSGEAQVLIKDSDKSTKGKSTFKTKLLTDKAGELSCDEKENMDIYENVADAVSSLTPSKATVMVKPQIMTNKTAESSESISTDRDEKTDSVNVKDTVGNGELLNGKELADSGNESFLFLSRETTTKSNLAKWTVADVYDFIKTVPGCSGYAEDFVAHDIDGEALMLLRADHLVTAMSMALGPAMKIISRINAVREDTESPAK